MLCSVLAGFRLWGQVSLPCVQVRFVEDNWENPALGAWGLGWEVWMDGAPSPHAPRYAHAPRCAHAPYRTEHTRRPRMYLAYQAAN